MLQTTSSRTGRISDVLHRELSNLIRNECRDPRIGLVTVSAVKPTRDLSYAKVFITVMEDDKRDHSIEILNNAAGFFRSRLAKKVILRTIPELRFIYDDSILAGQRMSALIDSITAAPKENE